MNFIEKNRTVEPHSESILFFYLQDANGAPVINQKVKIFAGPPPTGEPPYFVDDDPNNPNRRTDGNGTTAGYGRLDAFARIRVAPTPSTPAALRTLTSTTRKASATAC